jgi:hypothetical protein
MLAINAIQQVNTKSKQKSYNKYLSVTREFTLAGNTPGN